MATSVHSGPLVGQTFKTQSNSATGNTFVPSAFKKGSCLGGELLLGSIRSAAPGGMVLVVEVVVAV